MGQTLSEPVTTKNTSLCANNGYCVGSSSMQGWRINMEDAHVHLLELPSDPSASYFAVFDGHGGPKIAKYASLHLHQQIVSSNTYEEGRISDALIDGFLTLDEQMRENAELREEMSGSTAVVVLIKDNYIYCANAGDSRAVASVSGRAIPLSNDHKPSNEEECRRIFAAGGWVEFNRVNGNLALSRALGDFAFKSNENLSPKEQIVTACPEITTQAMSLEHEFIILACDGIWDVMSNEEVVDFCRKRLISGMQPDKICEELLNRCLSPDCELSGVGCDNMSSVLVCLLQDRTKEEYVQQLQKHMATELEEYDTALLKNVQLSTCILVETQNENEICEEIYSTPSHSPPAIIEQTSTTSETIETMKENTGTSDEDTPPPPNTFTTSGNLQDLKDNAFK